MGMTEDELAGLGLPPIPTIAAGNARPPLGPPQGYYTERAADPEQPQFANFSPYVTGDEWVPSTYNFEDRERLKARMNAAGLYGASGYQSGSWTGHDAAAYQQVLEAANATGVRDENVIIDNIASEVRKGPRVAGPRAPLVNRVSDPEAVRQIVRSTSLELTGARLTPEEEERIISAYRSYQQGVNQNEYAAGAAGGTVTGDMGAQDFAESQIESMRTGDVQAERGLDFMDRLLQSITQTQVPLTDTYKGQGLPQSQGEVL